MTKIYILIKKINEKTIGILTQHNKGNDMFLNYNYHNLLSNNKYNILNLF